MPDRSPDAAPDAVLLERFSFAQVPSARRLVESGDRAKRHLGLLVVGGVDYDRRELSKQEKRSAHMAPPSVPIPKDILARVRPGLLRFDKLTGTAREAEDVQSLFEATHDSSGVRIALSGPRADAARLRYAMVGMR